MTRRNAAQGIAAVAASLMLAACVGGEQLSSTGWTSVDNYFTALDLTPPEGNAATVCHAYNCRKKTRIAFSEADMETLRAAFAANSATPAAEREEIADAIAFLETKTGAVIGTSADPGGVLDGQSVGDPTRQDCVDEAATTTGYLVMLANNGMLKHHTVRQPAVRGILFDGRWQHFTAVVRETASGTDYAVDSWFRDNGQPAVVMTLQDWTYDWTPSSSKKLPAEGA